MSKAKVGTPIQVFESGKLFAGQITEVHSDTCVNATWYNPELGWQHQTSIEAVNSDQPEASPRWQFIPAEDPAPTAG